MTRTTSLLLPSLLKRVSIICCPVICAAMLLRQHNSWPFTSSSTLELSERSGSLQIRLTIARHTFAYILLGHKCSGTFQSTSPAKVTCIFGIRSVLMRLLNLISKNVSALKLPKPKVLIHVRSDILITSQARFVWSL